MILPCGRCLANGSYPLQAPSPGVVRGDWPEMVSFLETRVWWACKNDRNDRIRVRSICRFLFLRGQRSCPVLLDRRSHFQKKATISCPLYHGTRLGSTCGMDNIPLSMASTSWAVFSFSSVNSAHRLWTNSPSFFSHPTKLPSSIDQPSRGIVISVGMVI